MDETNYNQPISDKQKKIADITQQLGVYKSTMEKLQAKSVELEKQLNELKKPDDPSEFINSIKGKYFQSENLVTKVCEVQYDKKQNRYQIWTKDVINDESKPYFARIEHNFMSISNPNHFLEDCTEIDKTLFEDYLNKTITTITNDLMH